MVRFTGDAWLSRQIPLPQRDKTAHNVVQSIMPDSVFSSLKAEADGDLRVGARATAARQSGFHLDRRTDEAVRG